MTLFQRLRQWRRRAEFEAGLAEEIRFHREMSGAAAFGSEAMALEDSRSVWGFGALESLLQDVRYAVRGFRKSPGFALAVVGTIGAALGLNTTMFTVFNAYALRPFAVRDPWSLYRFTWYGKNGQGHRFTWSEYRNLAARQAPFSDVIASESLQSDVDGRTLFGQMVSGNFFTMLGAGTSAGRPLLPYDAAAPGSGAVLVLSYDAWQAKFAADPDLVGRTVHLRGHAFRVVGITNPGFTGLDSYPCSFWIPLTMRAAIADGPDLFARPEPQRLKLVGRLVPSLPPATARAALLAWSSTQSADVSAAEKPLGVLLESSATGIPLNRDVILTFIPLFTAFGLVLLIACANVSNMMLARGLARGREVAIRISLGAGRARLIRQLLTESLLLAIPAALLGVLLEQVTIEAGRRLLFATAPPALANFLMLPSLAPDWRVFGFILLASFAATLFFGLAPALETTRSRIVEANRGDFSSDYRPARLRSFLLVTQVAVCSLLLMVSAIVLRSQRRVTAQDIGLDLNGVWDIRMAERYQAAAVERLSAAPGVEAVAQAWRVPLDGSRSIALIPSGSRSKAWLSYNLVSSEYFSVFRIPVVRGRAFTRAEAETGAPVALVSESAARRLWPGQDALGRTVSLAPPDNPDPSFHRMPPLSEARVIGITRGVATDYLRLSSTHADMMVYFPTHRNAAGNGTLLVRVAGNSAAARRRIVETLDGIAPSIYNMLVPMDDLLGFQLYAFQITFWISSFLGGLALVMTVSGIYGVLSYLVSQRTKEIGIRVALGASSGDIIRMVVRQSARLALIGVAVGTAFAMAIAPVFANQLEAIRPYDGIAYGAAVVVVMAAALAASFAPSRRALRADPVTALRCD